MRLVALVLLGSGVFWIGAGFVPPPMLPEPTGFERVMAVVCGTLVIANGCYLWKAANADR